MRKLYFLLILAVVTAAVAGCPRHPDYGVFVEQAAQYNVEILRDTWGVPHMFGKTDPDVAFGLAYAHCEDDFETIFDAVIMGRAQSARFKGPESAVIDYSIHLLRIWDDVNAKYETDLSPEVRAICEAYADGVNFYCAKHPDLVPHPDMLPVTAKDMVAGFMLKAPMFFGMDHHVKRLMGKKRGYPVSQKQARLNDMGHVFKRGQELGSNTIAVGRKRSADHCVRLDVNSHQPYDGPVSWYEAHLHSEEGWDCVGGVFAGTPVILHGHNRNLGWAHTVNSPDLCDVYVLTMNPDNPNQYLLDGAWHDLEVREAKITVRLLGPLKWTFARECLWSPHHGPVLRRPHGVYAVRYAGMGDLRAVEQWYRMNKARNLEEFKDALRMRAIPSFNIGYGDKDGNIWYVYNATMPVRAEGYDWEQYLPGDTSETIWTEVVPFDALPQVLNPPADFIQNCNSTPYMTTLGEGNPDPADSSPTWGIETEMSNRALRALELYGGDDAITRDEFIEYKFDVKYSKDSLAREVFEEIVALPPQDDPLLQEAIDLIKQWDLSTDLENLSAAIAVATLEPLVRAEMAGRPAPDLLQTIGRAARILHKAHGRLAVPWKEVNRLRRGSKDVPLSGGPDCLRAVYGGGLEKDGTMTAQGGDTYVLIVEWDEDGAVYSESIHQYGSAITNQKSPHYADQVEPFSKLELKPVWLDEEDIRAHLERAYRPGEEAVSE